MLKLLSVMNFRVLTGPFRYVRIHWWQQIMLLFKYKQLYRAYQKKNKGFNFLEALNDSPIQLLLEVGTPADFHGCVCCTYMVMVVGIICHCSIH